MLIVPTASYLSVCELTPFITALVFSACLVGKSDFFIYNSQGPSWSPFQRLGHTCCFLLALRRVLAPDYTLLCILKQFHVWIYIRALGWMKLEPSDTLHLIFLRVSLPSSKMHSVAISIWDLAIDLLSLLLQRMTLLQGHVGVLPLIFAHEQQCINPNLQCFIKNTVVYQTDYQRRFNYYKYQRDAEKEPWMLSFPFKVIWLDESTCNLGFQ